MQELHQLRVRDLACQLAQEEVKDLGCIQQVLEQREQPAIVCCWCKSTALYVCLLSGKAWSTTPLALLSTTFSPGNQTTLQSVFAAPCQGLSGAVAQLVDVRARILSVACLLQKAGRY